MAANRRMSGCTQADVKFAAKGERSRLLLPFSLPVRQPVLEAHMEAAKQKLLAYQLKTLDLLARDARLRRRLHPQAPSEHDVRHRSRSQQPRRPPEHERLAIVDLQRA